MREAPEIAPEIRGLLEELVADPRSSIRLAPRRALRSWFDSDETIRAREISGTKLERHLVEVHREELAQLLREAAMISYWKAPVLTHRPIGSDGEPYDPSSIEPHWRDHVEGCLRGGDAAPGVNLLRQCLSRIAAGRGAVLAAASLSLVPNDGTRCYYSLAVPWSKPRTAIRLLEHLLSSARPRSLRPRVLLSLAARLCSADRLKEAQAAYRASRENDACIVPGACYSFTLSCFLGEEREAISDARALGAAVGPDDPEVTEVQRVVREWLSARKASELETASRVAARICDKVPESFTGLCRAFQS